MSRSKIEWTDAVWNPTTGCSKVSQGCKNCYAERVAGRFWGERKFTDVRCHPERLDQPLHWRKPRRVFVDSMSDLFHEDVPDEFIDQVYHVMMRARQHTFQILTKRPQRMLEYYQSRLSATGWFLLKLGSGWHAGAKSITNVWLGVSVENQAAADERIPLLLETPAAVRFVSCEPLLGPVYIQRYLTPNKFCVCCGLEDIDIRLDCGCGYCYICSSRGHDESHPIGICNGKPSIDWVITGGESGPHARPMHPDWVRSLRDQCQDADVPFFFKQWGRWSPVCAQYPEGDNEPDLDEIDLFSHTICFGNRGTLYSEDRGLKQEYWCGYQPDPGQNPWFFEDVGKKAAGHLLDGREWREFPGGDQCPS